MNQFKAIAAMSENRVIGRGNQIPWHLPEDFKWFKQMTTGHIVVMGRKTFESLGRPLPNRTTIVLSRSRFSYPGVQTVSDLNELSEFATRRDSSPLLPSPGLAATLSPPDGERDGVKGGSETMVPKRDIFICGGAQVYAQTLPLCSDLYLTLVKRVVEGDAFFPPFEGRFELVEEILNRLEFKIIHYRNLAL
jgi:dihydrofolate reductase